MRSKQICLQFHSFPSTHLFAPRIRVTFTIADLQSLTEEDDYNDPALDDEFEEGSQGRSNRGESSSNDPSAEEDVEPAYPARLNVTIEKSGKGAMHIETVSQDGLIQIENVSYFRKPELAEANSAEKDWARQNLYIGPPFRNLDSDLQMMLERYLDERGVNAELAMFVPEYIDFKEQREYVTWLKGKRRSYCSRQDTKDPC
jgi:complement component 1 Q subcomponent-binding protein